VDSSEIIDENDRVLSSLNTEKEHQTIISEVIQEENEDEKTDKITE